MDSEKQRIYETLNKIVGARGGKRKRGGAKSLEEMYPELKNPYEDDGSIEHEKLYSDIVATIANYLFEGKVTDDNYLQAMKAVPEATINKVIKQLRESWEIDNEAMIEQYREASKAEKDVDEMNKDARKKNYIDALKGETPADLRKRMKLFNNPKLLKSADRLKAIRGDTSVGNVLTELGKRNIQQNYPAEFLAIKPKDGFGEGYKRKNKLSAAEKKRRSDRMKAYHKSKK